jgi:UDP-GlcNAc:undecaprenyl-phosphate GlcNAc-1-phosphate transferase
VGQAEGRSISKTASSGRSALVFGIALVLFALCVRAGARELAPLLIAACATTWALCPAVAALAMRWGAAVDPGGRSIHATRTPRLGGLALYLPIVCSLLLAGGEHAAGLIAGGTIVLVAGGWDDLRGLSPRSKIAAQLLAALILVADGYRITNLRLDPLGALPIGGFEGAAIVVWIILVTNAFNLIDGVDGLAATLALVAALAHAALGSPPALALAMAGACLGFLRHNLPPARMFLGDTGSMLLGFYLAALPLAAPGPLNLPLAAGLVAIPLGDVAACVARRWLRAKPLFAADRGHIHHRLLRLWGGSPRRVLLGLGTLGAAQALAILLAPDLWGLLGVAVLWGATLLYVFSRARPDWPQILLHRRAFRRIHLASGYARGALPLCECPEDVRGVLQRVVCDLDLCAAEVSGMRIERGPPRRGTVVERVDCGGATATWAAAPEQGDPTLLEEKRAVMCDLLRLAHRALLCYERVVAVAAEAAPPCPPPPLIVAALRRPLPQQVLAWAADLNQPTPASGEEASCPS